MTKLRAPITFAQAITRVAGQIGWPACASIASRSERTVRLWSEPDQDSSPTLHQALALDTAFAAAGGEGAPIADTYAMLLGIQVVAATACHDALAASIADTAREVGEAIACSIPVTNPGASRAQVMRALIEVEQGEGALRKFAARLKSFVLPGAGPCTGNHGGAV